LLSGPSDFSPKLVSHIARCRFFSITAIHHRGLLSATLLFFFCVALSLECCCCALLSIPIHTNAQAHEYNTFVPILSFFSQCLFLLSDEESTSTRVVIHEFSLQ
jgi:hypothetical protein